MASTNIVPFGLGVGANVLDPADYAALPSTSAGYSAGIAQSQQLNTTWRQSAFAAAALANFLVSQGITQNDDGNVANFVTNIQAAIKQVVGAPNVFTGGTTTGTANAQVLATVIPATGFALNNGYTVIATAGFTNTGATTMNIAGSGAEPVKKLSGSSLVSLTGGEIIATDNFSITWNSTNTCWVLQTTPALGAAAYLNTAGHTIESAAGNLETSIALGQCIFQYVSATSATLSPKNGNVVFFPTGSLAVIPGAAITTNPTSAYLNGTAAQALSANTLYYAYLWFNGSAFVIDWSATGHVTDASTGIEIKNGDNTRVLVGAAMTNASGQFTNNNATKQLRSWFNDHGVVASGNFSTTRTTASTTPAEPNQEIRVNVLLWPGENVHAQTSGTVTNTGAFGTGSGLGVDSTTTISGSGSGVTVPAGGDGMPSSTNYVTNALSEGNHFFTWLGFINGGGTASFNSGDYVTVETWR